MSMGESGSTIEERGLSKRLCGTYRSIHNSRSSILKINDIAILRGLGARARKAQAQLQQLVPHVAAREPFDHAVDAGGMDECGFDLHRGVTPDIAFDHLLARTPDACIAHRLLQRPAAR